MAVENLFEAMSLFSRSTLEAMKHHECALAFVNILTILSFGLGKLGAYEVENVVLNLEAHTHGLGKFAQRLHLFRSTPCKERTQLGAETGECPSLVRAHLQVLLHCRLSIALVPPDVVALSEM